MGQCVHKCSACECGNQVMEAGLILLSLLLLRCLCISAFCVPNIRLCQVSNHKF